MREGKEERERWRKGEKDRGREIKTETEYPKSLSSAKFINFRSINATNLPSCLSLERLMNLLVTTVLGDYLLRHRRLGHWWCSVMF